jgi:hypothetical protein
MEHVRVLKKLEVLDLNYTEVTDVGLGRLIGLTRLKELILTDTQITDRGMAVLLHFPKLEQLQVIGLHGVTDASLQYICTFRNFL